MSRIKGRDTKPELILRKALWREGLRYRIRYHVQGRSLVGRPDIVFPGKRLVIFVDGCFWHGCPEHATKPKKNAASWAAKLRRNKERDREVVTKLKSQGWRVIRVWEHDVNRNLSAVVRRIKRAWHKAV